jgi:hypothetical protein
MMKTDSLLGRLGLAGIQLLLQFVVGDVLSNVLLVLEVLLPPCSPAARHRHTRIHGIIGLGLRVLPVGLLRLGLSIMGLLLELLRRRLLPKLLFLFRLSPGVVRVAVDVHVGLLGICHSMHSPCPFFRVLKYQLLYEMKLNKMHQSHRGG